LIGSEHIERFIPLADPANERDLKAEAAAQREADAAGASGTRHMPSMPDERTEAREPPRSAQPPRAAAPSRAAAPATGVARPAGPGSSTLPAVSAAATAAPAHTAGAALPRNAAASSGQAAGPPDHAAAPTSSGATTVTREMPRLAAGKRPGAKGSQGSPDSPTATREMPQPFRSKRHAPAPVGTAQVARTERRGAEQKAAARPRQPARIAAPSDADAAREQVIADAARLVQWGRKWYELAELIARMADRPPLPEVRRILKDNKTAIEKKAGGR
jgi:hypothetical protein